MRPLSIVMGILASIATILTYLNLEPPWVRDHLPRFVLPNGNSDGAGPATQPVFLSQYESGLGAARRHDFNMAVEFYKSATTAPDATAQEREKAYDALGYSYFRMHDYAEADGALTSALQIDPSAVTPRINRLKVACGRGDSTGAVQAALQEIRNSTAGDAYNTRETETDKELFRVCAYAGVAPQ